MDITRHRYYKINRIIMSALGVWPYLPRRERYTRIILSIIVVWSQIFPQIFAVYENLDDPQIFIKSISPFVVDLACVTKGANLIVNIDKIFELLERIRLDWLSVIDTPEQDILDEYTDIGRKFTIAYTAGMCGFTALFLGQPIIPKALEAMKILNGSKDPILPLLMHYYGFEFENYYYSTLAHTSVATFTGIFALIAADTIFLMYVQHACGMFTVIGHQLQSMRTETAKDAGSRLRQEDDAAFQYLIVCIKKHKAVIEFANLIESTYTWPFFVIIGFNMLMMSVTGYLTVANLEKDPEEALRFGIFALSQIMHLYFQSFFSERLRTHSAEFRYHVYRSNWVGSSLRTQRLFGLIIMRTSVPCQLTSGKIIPMSMETFTTVLKTSMSYFTLLRSIQ